MYLLAVVWRIVMVLYKNDLSGCVIGATSLYGLVSKVGTMMMVCVNYKRDVGVLTLVWWDCFSGSHPFVRSWSPGCLPCAGRWTCHTVWSAPRLAWVSSCT